MKVGLSYSENIKEIIDEVKKDMGVPDEDILIMVHVRRKDLERVCASLELSGVTQQIGVMRPISKEVC